jgi:hypothetical protein
VEVVAPTRKEARARLVGQLDRILDNLDQTIVRAIAANLEAFAVVADHAAEITAPRKEVEELKLQNRILLDEIARNRPEDGPERRDLWKNLDKISLGSNNGREKEEP